MNRFQTNGLIGLAGLGVLATLDSALGLGGGALLADICRTVLDDDPAGGMGGMAMEVKPVPLIALSMAATGAAIWVMTRDQKRVETGRTAPDGEEQAAILSAMVIVAASQGRTTREEIRDVFRIVTEHELDDDLVDLAFARYLEMVTSGRHRCRMAPVSTGIGRRRALSAALIMGCVARPSTETTPGLIESIALDIGATSSDISAAKSALAEWQDGTPGAAGVSPVMVLRHRSLRLAPV